ncbi:MAG: hypothetical protein ACP5OA_02625 [Candidatus Woesearchaeota archaeon]
MSETDMNDSNDINKNTTRDDIQKNMDSLNDIVDFVSENPGKVAGVGMIVGAMILGKCCYNAGEEHSFNKILELQNATKIEKPYNAFGPNSMVSSQPAEMHLVKMKEGQQFWYQGKIVTLLDKKEDDILGTIGYFSVGKNLLIVPIGSLPDDMTIHETFTKYSRK